MSGDQEGGYTVTVNGTTRRRHLSRDAAESIAEEMWNITGYHTQAIAPDGTIICEFES